MDKNILEKNLNLRKNNMKASIVEVLEGRIEEKVVLDVFPTKTGKPSFKISIDDKEGSFMLGHSAYDPEAEAERNTLVLDYFKNSMFILFGMGFTYHLEKILEKANPESRIIVIEPYIEVYENALKNVDFKNIFEDKRVCLIIGLNPANVMTIISDIISKHALNLSYNIQYVSMPYYSRFVGNELKIIRRIKDITVFGWRALGNCHVDHNIGFIQTVLNLDDIINSVGIKDMLDVYEKKSAIVVAAGPSLEKNIHFLKKAKGKALIFAVDAILNKLLNIGIVPDVVVTVERLGVYEPIFLNVQKPVPKEVVLACPSQVENGTMEFFKNNNKITGFQLGAGTMEYFDDIIDKGFLATGTSAAYLCVDLVRRMGFERLALIGQDLSYGNEGKIYCDGVCERGNKIESERIKTKKGYATTVKDSEGNDMKSNILWKDQLVVLEKFISIHKIKVFNATEGGAYIEGTESIALDEYIEKYCTDEIEDINDIIKRKDIEKSDRKNTYKKLFDKMNKDYEYIMSINKELSQKSSKLSELNEKYNKNGIEIKVKDIDRIVDEINNISVLIRKVEEHKFLKLYYQGIIAVFRKDIEQNKKEDIKENIKKNIEIQNMYISMISKLFNLNKDFFGFAVRFVDSRIKDAEVEKNIKTILKMVLEKNNIDKVLVDNYYNNHEETDSEEE